MKPWPEACKVYQAKNQCSNYEMSLDSMEGPKVISCEKTADCTPVIQEPKCVTTYDQDEKDAQAEKDKAGDAPAGEADLTKCFQWFDGCNKCKVDNDGNKVCGTENTCETDATPFCGIKKPVISLDDQNEDNNNGETIFKTRGDECSAFKNNAADVLDPWPENCEIY